ncbi:Chaperone required for the assembly of the F1-ATPase [Devosia crocina]|uniref:Chaperone required for the assembly of the F1-ATPase n=1 Tax=Devosia crocina TaxID=429728 RepID=A0A1I7NDZ8_9HYPH|nr:ATP12 family protein [Devosia crocina]SFV32861.1 Chaperone required for the assembly of the F1-ATPase [Devosia crocina]
MRDQLEDALNNQQFGFGQAQHINQTELPKRFYSSVDVARTDQGFTVTLDGRPVRTPGRKLPVFVPALPIAQAMATEWAAQDKHIDPTTMPMVRLINSAVESGEENIPAFRAEIGKFAANDLLLYRADAPQELVDDQERHWDGALVLLARQFDVAFQPTIGIIHQPQPAATLTKLDAALEGQGLFSLTALVSITGLTGSGLLALALLHKLMTPDEVWTAAHVDEDHQIRLWGEDEEAMERRAKRRVEFDTAIAVVEALRT